MKKIILEPFVRGSLVIILLIVGLYVWICPQKTVSERALIEEYLLCIFSDDFGYTLIGAKPASLDNSWTHCLRDFYPELVEQAHTFMSKVFAKSDLFIFRKINGSLWLINKKQMSKQILKNQDLGAFIHERFGGETGFFDHLQQGDLTLFDLLDYRVELIAIALGYGRDNGAFYLRKIMVGEYLQKYPLVQSYPFDGFPFPDKIRGMNGLFCRYLEKIEKPALVSSFRSLNDEWDWIKQNEWELHMNSRSEIPYYLCLPAYISCKSIEARRVHRKFVRARNKLAKIFCNKKPSEAIAQVVAMALLQQHRLLEVN